MIVRILCKPKLNRTHKTLCCFAAIAVHVPALRSKPILELVQTYCAGQIIKKLPLNLSFGNHGDSTYTTDSARDGNRTSQTLQRPLFGQDRRGRNSSGSYERRWTSSVRLRRE